MRISTFILFSTEQFQLSGLEREAWKGNPQRNKVKYKKPPNVLLLKAYDFESESLFSYTWCQQQDGFDPVILSPFINICRHFRACFCKVPCSAKYFSLCLPVRMCLNSVSALRAWVDLEALSSCSYLLASYTETP